MVKFEFLRKLSFITTQIESLSIKIKNGAKQPHITSTIKYLRSLLDELI